MVGTKQTAIPDAFHPDASRFIVAAVVTIRIKGNWAMTSVCGNHKVQMHPACSDFEPFLVLPVYRDVLKELHVTVFFK
jgi:hypothetical protein